MKIKIIICSVFTVSFFNVKAQETISADVNIKTEPTDQIDFNETSAAVVYSKSLNTKNQIKNTFEYFNLKVNYEVGSFLAYDNLESFNQFKNKMEFLQQVSSTTKLNYTVTPTVNYQQNLDFSDFTILGSLEIIQQINSKTNITIGAARTTVFGSPKFMPVFALNYKISNESNLLLGFPDSKLSYSNNIRNKFSINNSFNGNFYNLDQKNNIDDSAKANLSQITSTLEYERNIDTNWFVNFKAGYDFNKKYELIDSENHKTHDFNISNGYILGVGIKYKQ